MCKHCEGKNNFADVGIKLDTDKYRVYLCGGNSKPSEDERFDFCPKCGTPLGEVKPLTVEQLRQMDGDKISIHYIGRLKGFYRDEIAPYYGQLEQYIQNDNGTLAACELPLKFYGTTWTAFDREPKGETE